MKSDSAELIRKIEKSNLLKEDKKLIVESLNKGDNNGFLKKLFYSLRILDLLDVDLKDIIDDILQL
ncbi:hypothetical protein [Emticicia sp. W12TSBA100-4]|uniref:hypothetical protein n=1 Tax=Emticicia sp. W12TSBA100-4 TaxID=3160965 RepID=UPI00330625AA